MNIGRWTPSTDRGSRGCRSSRVGRSGGSCSLAGVDCRRRTGRTASVAVVVPARNEAAALGRLLPSLTTQLRPGDRLVVVDDGSTDGTAAVAAELGATVITATSPPDGWSGKAHACWTGAAEVDAAVVAFVDADVVAGPGLLDALAARAGAVPLVSVQPWHTPDGIVEQASLFGNLVALMGSGRWALVAARRTAPIAFGPVIAMHRDDYLAIGGHAHPDVRGAVAEDVALARLVGDAAVYDGRPFASYRMYPGGPRDLVGGWTRTIAAGLGTAPAWATLATAAWISSAAAAPFVGWWAYAMSAIQVGLLSRRVGRFSPIAAALYPIPLAVFVGITIRSLGRRLAGRPVRWKDRDLANR